MEYTIDHKRGDTISWEIEYTDDLGGVVDLTSYEIRSQARLKKDKTVILFDVASTNELPNKIDVYDAVNGKFRIVLDTETFPVGIYLVDIQMKFGNLIKSSETYELNIYEDITK